MSRQTESHSNPTLAHFGQMGSDKVSLVEGDGSLVYDEEGKEYIDFTSQLYCVNAGHSNETIQNRIKEQIDRIQYVSSAKDNDVRTEFSNRLIDISPNSLQDVFFAISGSEANEAAIQIAREQQDANTVLTRWRSYHGGTYMTAGLTGDPAIRNPIEKHGEMPGNVKFLPPFDGVDNPFNADSQEELAEQAADHLEYIIRNQGPDSIAALVTEIVGGSSGAFTPPPGYFERVRELCNKYDILLIADEVITGFGRCGDWFGSHTETLEPDMITFAKGVTSSYIPLAGVLTTSEIGERLREDEMDIGQTFAGSPVACAAGLGALEEYQDLIGNVNRLAPFLQQRLESLQAHDVVGDVRGRGFLWCIEMVDPERDEPIFDPRVDDGHNPVSDVAEEAKERGVLIGGGRPGFQAMVAPPFCTTKEQIDTAVDAIDESISAVFD
jgi:taurine--2-oxoglutarate transaminase